MTRFPYDLSSESPPRLGLIVLQADETIELDFRRLIPAPVELLTTRIASGAELNAASIAAMEARITAAAALLPEGAEFTAIGYACTSASAQLGPLRVAGLIRDGACAAHVTEPVTALVTACRALGLRRLAVLSPYVAPVSARLRAVLAEAGIATPRFGSFEESREALVARISAPSIIDAALALARDKDPAAPSGPDGPEGPDGIDGIFLSCTNLRGLDLIAPLEAELGLPVLTSNQVLAWHMMGLAGLAAPVPGRLQGLRSSDTALRSPAT
ncbi:maleate cis-trans isomerase family protein [Pseudooceanicola algae]|uniref:Arylmalonate decarboxylase n=1 Tax=Pseudooceanicola algae TaxID=1537215 RepID=A0A418SHV3_9RHOB|nr:aspartate/glutamate racemase family protein [Pseudooceanicola algae]QPM90227.1 Arylmalonate decarboxylase [Pseudooceanicola algae]